MGNAFRKKKDNDTESFLEISLPPTTDASATTVNKSVAEKVSENDPQITALLAQWDAEQNLLKKANILTQDDDFESTLHFIAGIDISFPPDKNDLVHACACLVVLSYPQLDIVYQKLKIVHLTSVYIPQYLAFREAEPFQKLFAELAEEHPELYPQLILLDGNGILHPKKFGIACHLGVKLSIPTIGVAKKLFHVDGLEKNDAFKKQVKSLSAKGVTLDLVGESGFVYGRALRSTDSSTNPIFVSVGHKVGLDTAIQIVGQCCKVRVPEPIRWADILSREYIRDYYTEHADSCSSYEDLNARFLRLSTFY